MSTKRPSMKDPSIITAAAKKIYPSVRDWLASGGDQSPEEEVIADLERAIRRSPNLDGYNLATRLTGWSPDSELVEILDGISWRLYKAHDDAVAKWVQEEKIEPAFKVGDEVTIQRIMGLGERGRIVSVKKECAMYGVQPFKEEFKDDQFLIEYERVQLAT